MCSLLSLSNVIISDYEFGFSNMKSVNWLSYIFEIISMIKLNHQKTKESIKMKVMTIKTNKRIQKRNVKEEFIVNLASDWFRCQKCGAVVQKKVLGNTSTCSDCGGTMDRI